MCREANVRSGATCFTCEYTTVPRILTRSATANESTVNRNVIASTRAGIPIQRGPPELLFAMRSGYTIGREHRECRLEHVIRGLSSSPGDGGHGRLPERQCEKRGSRTPRAHTLQYRHVANPLRDRPRPRRDRAKNPGFTGS